MCSGIMSIKSGIMQAFLYRRRPNIMIPTRYGVYMFFCSNLSYEFEHTYLTRGAHACILFPANGGVLYFSAAHSRCLFFDQSGGQILGGEF
jgi:hypothetical protein